MLARSDDDILDGFTEAALIPELWPSALDTIADAIDCQSALLLAVDGTTSPAWVANQRGESAVRKFVDEGWAARNTQGARTVARNEPAFISDYDIFTPEELQDEPFYEEFMRPNGLAWGCGTVVGGPTNDKILVSIHRPMEMGPLRSEPVRHLTALRPSIARACFVASRLRLEQARAAVTALEMIGLPAVVLTQRGQVKIANELFGALVPKVMTDSGDRLRLVSSSADALLERALYGGDNPAVAGASIPIPASDIDPPMLLHLMPVRGAARDIFGGTKWLLVVVPIEGGINVSPSMLQGLFDLTPAEARVASGLAANLTTTELAGQLNLSHETIRTQLKAVMSKTGVTRQAELVMLIGRANVRAVR